MANLLRVCNGRVCFATLAGRQSDVRVEKGVRFERSGVPFGVSCGFESCGPFDQPRAVETEWGAQR